MIKGTGAAGYSLTSEPSLVLPSLDPEERSIELLVEQGVAAQRNGEVSVAARLYRAALVSLPTHPEASHNLAILELQAGRLNEALPLFRIALEHDCERELYWQSYARALLVAERVGDAAALLEEAGTIFKNSPVVGLLLKQTPTQRNIKQPPDIDLEALARAQALALAGQRKWDAAAARLEIAIAQRGGKSEPLQLELASVKAQSGKTGEAAALFESILEANPHSQLAHYRLGSLLSETGQVAEGFGHLMKSAHLRHAEPKATASPEKTHKVKHDAEQRTYLVESGVLAESVADVPFYIGDGGRLSGPVINPEHRVSNLKERWERASPQFLVIDDLLTDEALEKLRAYCAKSTVWKRVYDAGYIGATPADGFAAPFLAQMVEELQVVFSSILAPHPFKYLGAFKYDSELSTGTNTHADFSAINVNLYIAPDEANLDPSSGGMVIWDLAAASESELRFFNTNESKLREHLKTHGATQHRIPHRQNRAVIFSSGLFHRTDECIFEEGYLNKRINVSFLFGDWNRT